MDDFEKPVGNLAEEFCGSVYPAVLLSFPSDHLHRVGGLVAPGRREAGVARDKLLLEGRGVGERLRAEGLDTERKATFSIGTLASC